MAFDVRCNRVFYKFPGWSLLWTTTVVHDYEMDWRVKKFGWFKFGECLAICKIRQTFPHQTFPLYGVSLTYKDPLRVQLECMLMTLLCTMLSIVLITVSSLKMIYFYWENGKTSDMKFNPTIHFKCNSCCMCSMNYCCDHDMWPGMRK